MKKNLLTSFFLQAFMILLAVVFNVGVAMAVEVGDNGSDTDPNDGKPLDNATPDAQEKGLDQQGKGSTGSAVTQSGLSLDTVDDYVSKFRAWNYVMHTDFMRKARQIKVDTKEPENWEVGEGIIDCETKATTSQSDGPTQKLSLYKNDHKLFKQGGTVMVEGVSGYDEKGESADGTPLILYIDDVSKTGDVTVHAVNGVSDDGEICVPRIEAGTTLHIMAPGMSESEVEIAPDNAIPTPVKVYLQKKVCSITITDLFERIHKKAKWTAQDVRDWALHMFRRKCTRSMLISKGCKFIKEGSKRTGEEFCYLQEGVLRQLRLGYNIDKLSFEDLIGIQAALFTDNATTNEMDVYMGKYFTIGLLNIDFSKHPEMKFKEFTDGETGIEITSFKTNFGRLNFKYEHALDDLGYGQCAIAFSMSEAKRFYYKKEKKLVLDHNKGEGGEVREAKSEYYIQDDCLQLTGMNSMFIAPTDMVGSFKLSALEVTITGVDSLSDVVAASTAVGNVYYLKDADDTHPAGLYAVKAISDGNITWEVYKSDIRA